MASPDRNPLRKQGSMTSLEQSLNMMSPPQQEPITIYPRPHAGSANMSKVDLEIAERLQQLRAHHQEHLPTEEEVSVRLAKLKGLPEDHFARKNNIAYQPPDRRTMCEKSDDLLKQVMEEASLDAMVPNPDDEIEARLARLRGKTHDLTPQQVSRVAGVAAAATAAAAAAYTVPAHAYQDPDIDQELQDMDFNEVDSLMKEATASTSAAQKSLAELNNDPEVAQAIALATQERKQKTKHKKKSKSCRKSSKGERRSSDEERNSKSDDSDYDICVNKALDAKTEQAEIMRIVDMYTKAAEEKKKKKLKKKAAAAAAASGGTVESEPSDFSSSELSSDSEEVKKGKGKKCSKVSSDSEKFSESEDLTD